MNPGDVSSLVRAYDDGLYTFPELAATMLRWSQEVPLDELADQLPRPCRRKFAVLMRELYDNDHPVDAFISLNDEPMTAELLARVRSWLDGDG